MPPRAPSQVRVETLIARGRLVLAVFLLLALRVAMPIGADLVPSRRGGVSRLHGASWACWSGRVSATALDGRAPRMPSTCRCTPIVPLPAGRPGAVDARRGSCSCWWRRRFDGAGAARSRPARWPSRCTSASGRRRPRRCRTRRMAPAELHHAGPADGGDDRLCRPGRRVRRLARQTAGAAGGVGGPDPDRPLVLPSEMLAQTSLVLEAPRTLLVWEEAEEPFTEFALWSDGRAERFREAPGTFGDVVAERVRDSGFFCRNLDARLPVTFLRSPTGLVSWSGMPIDQRFRERFRDSSAGCWPLRGRGLSADGSSASTSRGSRCQDLTVGDVVADLTAARLSQAYLVRTHARDRGDDRAACAWRATCTTACCRR